MAKLAAFCGMLLLFVILHLVGNIMVSDDATDAINTMYNLGDFNVVSLIVFFLYYIAAIGISFAIAEEAD
jgi:uncharacterized membrane protein